MKGFSKKKKRFLSFLAFFLLVLSMPLFSYFLSSDMSFDERGRAQTIEFTFTFTIEPKAIRNGEEALLSWSAPGAYRCWGFDGWSGQKELSGSEIISPVYSTIYGMSCNRDDYEVTRWVVLNVEDSSVQRSCATTADCYRHAPYEICFQNYCIRGDIKNDGKIGMADFEEFKKDYINFQTNGWNDNLRRSDLNIDSRVSMDDYSVFVTSYRLFNGLN